MTHTDPAMIRRRDNQRKLLSHAYSFFDAILAFFTVWAFAQMMRIAIGLSTEVYWLAKAWIEQVSFIVVAILMFVAIVGGQHLFERGMIRKQVWLPKSFLVITALIALLYAVCKIIVVTY